MIYAVDNRRAARPALRIRPYRLLACALVLMIAGLLVAIDQTPTYERERMEAEARYLAALQENRVLRQSLILAESEDWQTREARDAYGYVYPGEIIYQAEFTAE